MRRRTPASAAASGVAERTRYGPWIEPSSPDSALASGEQILAQLREPDEATLHFSPWGLGGQLEPADSARYLAGMLSHAVLDDAVSDDVRRSFERVRTVFLHGLLDYDLFTAAEDLAHLVLEGALRTRFLTYYNRRVHVTRDGVEEVLVVSTFAEYAREVRAARGRREVLRLDDEPREPAPGSYPGLYRWARARGLLAGQRNARVLDSIVAMRNHVAHPEGHRIDMPPSVMRFLRDVAEIINKLWGRDTEGGRLFPAPVARWARVAALAPRGSASVVYSALAAAAADTDRGDWTYGVFAAALQEELTATDWKAPGALRFAWEPGFQMTELPVALLWGPGDRASLAAALGDGLSDAEAIDEVAFLDREFYVRLARDGVVEPPRDAADVVASELGDAPARWFVVRADYPVDAHAFVRARCAGGGSDVPASLVARLTGDARARAHAAGRG